MTEQLLVAAGAVHSLQEGLQVAIAGGNCLVGHVLDAVIDGMHLLFGQGVAVGLGLCNHSVGSLDAFLGAVQEIVGPGGAGLFVSHLLVQRLGGVQAEHAGVSAVLVHELVDGADVVQIHLCAADLLLANGHGDGVALDDTAGADCLGAHGPQGYHQHCGNNDAEDDGINLQFLCFLLLGKLLFGHLCGSFFAAELLLAGCTHVINSSHLS